MTLADYIGQKGVTSVAVAAQLKVAHTTVLRWAVRGVPPKRVADVARVTGISAAELRPDLAAAFGRAA